MKVGQLVICIADGQQKIARVIAVNDKETLLGFGDSSYISLTANSDIEIDREKAWIVRFIG